MAPTSTTYLTLNPDNHSSLRCFSYFPENMRRFAQPRSSLLVSRICRPSASRPYATKGKNADTTTTTSQTEVESSDLDAKNVSGSNLGFDDWSEVNTRDKTIKTAAGQLPISPLLDPAWREARQRKQKKLTQAEATHNRFQRKLMDNVFGEPLQLQHSFCRFMAVLGC